MAKTMTAAVPQAQIVDRRQSERLFYVVAASTMLIFTVVGVSTVFSARQGLRRRRNDEPDCVANCCSWPCDV